MRFLGLNFHLIWSLTILLVFGLGLASTSCTDDDNRRCGIESAFMYGPDGLCSVCATQDGNIIMGYDEQFCYVPGSYSNYILNGFSFGDSTISGSVSDIYLLARGLSSNGGDKPYDSGGNLFLGYPKRLQVGVSADEWGYERCKEIQPNTILAGGPVIEGLEIVPPEASMPNGSQVSFVIYGFDATGDCHEDWGYASGYADGDTVRLKVYWRAVDFPNPSGDTVLVDSAFIFPLPDYLK